MARGLSLFKDPMIHMRGTEDNRKVRCTLTFWGLFGKTSHIHMHPSARDPGLCWVGREGQQGGQKVLEAVNRGLGMAGSKWVPGKGSRRVHTGKARGVFLWKLSCHLSCFLHALTAPSPAVRGHLSLSLPAEVPWRSELNTSTLVASCMNPTQKAQRKARITWAASLTQKALWLKGSYKCEDRGPCVCVCMCVCMHAYVCVCVAIFNSPQIFRLFEEWGRREAS